MYYTNAIHMQSESRMSGVLQLTPKIKKFELNNAGPFNKNDALCGMPIKGQPWKVLVSCDSFACACRYIYMYVSRVRVWSSNNKETCWCIQFEV